FDCARDLDRALDRDLARARARALARHGSALDDLTRALAGEVDSAGVDGTCLDQVRARLNAMRHDYAGADLRTLELAGLDLQGVRWSDTTQWPPQWEDTIRGHSVPLPGGGYEYRPGGGTHHPVPART